MKARGLLLAALGGMLAAPLPPSVGSFAMPSGASSRGKGRNKSPRRHSGVAAARRAARKARAAS